MCVVIDLKIVCLICLEPSKDLHPIFTADEDDPELLIAQKIAILSELKIDQNNQTLPRKICSKCFQDLRSAWRFRKNCKAAVTIYQTIVKLEHVQLGNTAIKDLNKHKVKVQDDNMPTCTQTDNESEGGENDSESLSHKKTHPMDEIKKVSDNVEGNFYEELSQNSYVESLDNEVDEFQELEESGENEQVEEFENDENLVEYYLTEDSIPEEMSGIEVKDATTSKQSTDEKESSLPICVENTNKASPRGRPRKQNLVQKAAKSKNGQTKTVGTVFVSEETTQREIRQVRTRKRKSLSPGRKTPKICEICGNSYRFQHALNAHMRRHYNDKPFPCECCDKAFVSNVELRRHMRVHTGQKPYACQYCERRFSDFGSRIKHERTHTGERPYLCITCGKTFAYPHVLSVHVRTHTGEKRFRCDQCNKGFTKKAYLMSHAVQHHNSFQIVVDDTMVKSQNRLKPKTFEESISPNEFVNEESIAETGVYVEDTNEGQIKIKLETDKAEAAVY